MKKRVLKVILFSLLISIFITALVNFIPTKKECGDINYGFPFTTYYKTDPNYKEQPAIFPDLGCADVMRSVLVVFLWGNLFNLIVYFFASFGVIYIITGIKGRGQKDKKPEKIIQN